MIKKVVVFVCIVFGAVITESFIHFIQAPADELKGPVHWYTFHDVVEMQKNLLNQ